MLIEGRNGFAWCQGLCFFFPRGDNRGVVAALRYGMGKLEEGEEEEEEQD